MFKWLCREECPELGLELNIPGNSEVQNTEDKFLAILTVRNNFDYEKVLKEIRGHFYLMFSFSLRFANEDIIKKRMEKVHKKYESE